MLPILYEDNHLLVVDKPAGIATMGAESGPTVYSLAAEYLKQKYNKPGNVFVGIVSRLDTFTSGVLVLARTSKAAARLSPQFGGQISSKKKPVVRAQKLYLAVVEGQLAQSEGSLADYVRKDDAARRMRVVESGAADSQLAELQYTTVGRTDDATIVAVKLNTGRKHQIRVQFSDRGHCVLGDRKYGSERRFSSGIPLHSWVLRITHPTLQSQLCFESPLPKSWNQFAVALPPVVKLRETVASALDVQFGSTTE